MIEIAKLVPGESPRTEGRDEEHIARLAELDVPLPPILVDRHTLQVIDGMHRLLAAVAKGQLTIEVEFFDGSAEDAFLRAVEANVAHGLPLPLADRRAAVARIVASHPHLSDRAIARKTGLGAKAVATIRRQSLETAVQVSARVGRDGKLRPLNSAEGRCRAAELLAERPESSLREVARLAGISPATVSDVRRRLATGQSPLPTASEPFTKVMSVRSRSAATHRMRLVESDPTTVLEKLVRDPSLRHKEEGRQLLRLLQQNAMGTQEWSELTAAVPAHCGALVVDLARQCAETWLAFAQELDERVRLVDQVAAASG
ncbi:MULTISPECIES: ParB/RepB/Spo0J family partition protein [Kitasatospora]|uniref:ParB/RepB/Spo0J family partition protein n=1 Tax=Kitasatospora TaxID=2063 RepID=UPI000C6FF535|nr:ParB N-terminal domain-containing protein [Kitasatospora sp. GP30]MDH6144075.1 ParB-like chromosome segregation protein Spo0J [Kitasatospora sp. GP30]